MGNTNLAMELRQLLEGFTINITKRFDEVHGYLILVDNHLSSIEQARANEDATTATTMAMVEHAAAIKN